MGTVGTIIKWPAIVAFNIATATTPSPIVRGLAVTIDSGTKLARLPAANTESIVGIATSDGDTDIGQVWVATGRGGFSVPIKPSGAVTFATGDPVYFNSTALDGTFTNVAGTNNGAVRLGCVVDNRLAADGTVEMAYALY